MEKNVEHLLAHSNYYRGLGIVLTPLHIADFFSDIVDITPDDVVYDSCTGTGNLLLPSIKKMISKSNGDLAKEKSIKECGGFGVEYHDDMYPLALRNMISHGYRGDNIINGSCFNDDIIKTIKSKKPTVGFLNPPYSSDINELDFVLNNLECLEKHGRCVAIVPMSCAIGSNKKIEALKKRLLENHTLKAVFSAPNDLFHPIGVVTVILVFEAHKPHDSSVKSFFGYFKDDGFVKQKNKGRVDRNKKWNAIKTKWLSAFKNKESIAGLSVTKEVAYKDEWVAEAYMETDYSTLTEEDFIKTIKEYVAYKVRYDD